MTCNPSRNSVRNHFQQGRSAQGELVFAVTIPLAGNARQRRKLRRAVQRAEWVTCSYRKGWNEVRLTVDQGDIQSAWEARREFMRRLK